MNFFNKLTIYGCIAAGLLYGGIGTIAILSFFKVRDGGADESSMLLILNDTLVGKIFVWIILTGSLCYIIARIAEAIIDPYNCGNSLRGKMKRFGIALSTVADMLIVYSAIRVLLGIGEIAADGQPTEERKMIAEWLQYSWGAVAVIVIGVVVCTTAVIQLIYGITKGYKERIDDSRLSPFLKSTIHVIAWTGYSSRAIILGIIGFFFLKAGITSDANHIVNTDKAFDFIGDNVSHVVFILLAIGTICYGVFMIAQGLTLKVKTSKP